MQQIHVNTLFFSSMLDSLFPRFCTALYLFSGVA